MEEAQVEGSDEGFYIASQLKRDKDDFEAVRTRLVSKLSN
jgi:hypothetical protein